MLSELCRGPQKRLSIALWECCILSSASLCTCARNSGGSWKPYLKDFAELYIPMHDASGAVAACRTSPWQHVHADPLKVALMQLVHSCILHFTISDSLSAWNAYGVDQSLRGVLVQCKIAELRQGNIQDQGQCIESQAG